VTLSATTVAFQATGQTQALTASESNYTGSFAATSSCAAVTVTPATSATGAFTLTAVGPASSGCTISVTGATGVTAATATATVPTPGGVQLRWVSPGYQNQSPPIPLLAGPINVIGTGSVFAATLVISETAYLGAFTTPALVTAANCGGAANVTIAAVASPAPSALPTPSAGQSLSFYTVTVNTTAIAQAPICTITASDKLTTPNTSTIQLTASSATGTFN
jgi:hypothetical protein